MADVRTTGSAASQIRLAPRGAKFTATEWRWMNAQLEAGTTRDKIAKDFAKRFPNNANVKAGKRGVGNRTYTRLRSKFNSSKMLAKAVVKPTSPTQNSYWQERAQVYGNTKESRTVVKGRVLDAGKERFRNVSIASGDVNPRNTADTLSNLAEGGVSMGTDSGPLSDPIEEPVDELGNRILVDTVLVIKGTS